MHTYSAHPKCYEAFSRKRLRSEKYSTHVFVEGYSEKINFATTLDA